MKPFIFVTPKYLHNSNGIKTVHKICHTINKMGGTAKLAFIGAANAEDVNNPDIQEIGLRDASWTNKEWNTPPLRGDETQLLEDSYVVYPETIIGNPLNSKYVVRYFGNREGNCNGKMIGIGPKDFLVAHARAVRQGAHYILFNSEINPAFRNQGKFPPFQRTIDATYIGKGSLYGPTQIMDNTILIEREWPKTQEQVALFLQNVRVFYTWDSWTAINVEAILCGAIPYFLRYEPWTGEDIDGSELGRLPRIDAANPTIDLPRFEAERKAMVEKIDALAASWDQRVQAFMTKVEQHFAHRAAA